MTLSTSMHPACFDKIMRFVYDAYLFSLGRNDMVKRRQHQGNTITLDSSEDVTFPVELDSAALSRTEVRKMGYGGTRENREGRSKGCYGQHHQHG